jgi:integrase
MRAHGEGSVTLDRRSKVWNFYWWESGSRRCKRVGTQVEYPTKSAAWQGARPLRDAVETKTTISTNSKNSPPTVKTLIESYRLEKMPTRRDTRRSYDVWLNNHIIPRWGCNVLSDLQARPVELWLDSLPLAPKSKVHIRGLLSVLWDFGMWSGSVPVQRNPIELVSVKNATKRKRQPRSLTVEEFQCFLRHLTEPFHLLALLCVCFGLRVSEALALKWSDLDWLGATLRVERSIVCQNVDDVKTGESRKHMTIDVACSICSDRGSRHLSSLPLMIGCLHHLSN